MLLSMAPLATGSMVLKKFQLRNGSLVDTFSVRRDVMLRWKASWLFRDESYLVRAKLMVMKH